MAPQRELETPEDFEAAWQSLVLGPQDGTIACIVTRIPTAQFPKDRDKLTAPIHTVHDSIAFTIEDGFAGDRWKKGKKTGSQVSITSLAVARLVARSDDRLHLFGNNLVVDLDLSAEALPVGTRLRLGTGMIEISAEPHDPCDRYMARFGKAAHDWVGDERHASRHLRGRMSRILQSGTVRVGERLERV